MCGTEGGTITVGGRESANGQKDVGASRCDCEGKINAAVSSLM